MFSHSSYHSWLGVQVSVRGSVAVDVVQEEAAHVRSRPRSFGLVEVGVLAEESGVAESFAVTLGLESGLISVVGFVVARSGKTKF